MGGVKTKIECSKITEGIRFSKPVFFNDGKNMFLAAGCPAKKYHLDALRRWEIPFLWTDGEEMEDVPELDVAEPEEVVDSSAFDSAPAGDSSSSDSEPDSEVSSSSFGSVSFGSSRVPSPAQAEDVDLSSFDRLKEPDYVRPKAVSYAAPRKPKVDRSGEEEVNIEDFIENFDEL